MGNARSRSFDPTDETDLEEGDPNDLTMCQGNVGETKEGVRRIRLHGCRGRRLRLR